MVDYETSGRVTIPTIYSCPLRQVKGNELKFNKFPLFF